MDQLPPDSHRAMVSHIDARARLMPAPEVEPPLVVVGVGVVRVVVLGAVVVVLVAARGAGRFFVPTSTTASTGCFVTVEATTLTPTILPSLRVRRSVMVRTPATPFVSTLVWLV